MKDRFHHSICFITNIGPHYRFPIFSLMGESLPCCFYIGDKGETPIKTFKYELLKGYQKTLKNIFIHHFYWQKGSLKLIFKPYKFYILDGEPYCLSSWFILFFAKLLNKKTIAWTHGWYGRETAGKKILKKIFYSLHDKLMLYNEYAIKLMTKEGFSPNKLYCIANSMDSITSRYQKSDIFVIFIPSLFSMLNASIFSTLLTGGLFILFLLFACFDPNEEKTTIIQYNI